MSLSIVIFIALSVGMLLGFMISRATDIPTDVLDMEIMYEDKCFITSEVNFDYAPNGEVSKIFITAIDREESVYNED